MPVVSSSLGWTGPSPRRKTNFQAAWYLPRSLEILYSLEFFEDILYESLEICESLEIYKSLEIRKSFEIY